MIEPQHLTGMRPGEVMSLKTGGIDLTANVWIYSPQSDKTQDKGFKPAISIRPKARAILLIAAQRS